MGSLQYHANTAQSTNPTADPEKGGDSGIPSHWKYDIQGDSFFPGSRRLGFLVFRFLCLIAFGSGNLGKLWDACHEIPPGLDKESKKERQDAWDTEATRVKERLEHLNTVVRPQIVDRRFAGFDCNVWSSLVCFLLHW